MEKLSLVNSEPINTEAASQYEENKNVHLYREKLKEEYPFSKLAEKYGREYYKYATKRGIISCSYDEYLLTVKERYNIYLETDAFCYFEYNKIENEKDKDSSVGDLMNWTFSNTEKNFKEIFHIGLNSETGYQNVDINFCAGEHGEHFFREIDSLLEQKPDVIIVLPNSGIPLSFLIKSLCKEISESNPEFKTFQPKFKIPKFKPKYITGYLDKLNRNKEVDKNEQDEVSIAIGYFRDLILEMSRNNLNRITLCDDFIFRGTEFTSTKYLIERAVNELKRYKLLDHNYDIQLGIISNGADHVLNASAFTFIPHEQGVRHLDRTKASEEIDWTTRKYLNFVGKQVAKDYLCLKRIRNPGFVRGFGYDVKSIRV